VKNKILTYLLLLIDWFTATLSWGFFYFLRKTIIEKEDFSIDSNFYNGVFLIPLAWLILYALQGTYFDVRRLYRLKIIGQTIISTLIGTIILFFTLLLDDEITGYQSYYSSIFILFSIYFLFTFVPRIVFVSFIVRSVQANKSGFRTLLIGGDKKALSIYNEIVGLPKGIGNQFVGFVNLNGIDKFLSPRLEHLGHIDDLVKIVRDHKIEEVIIALENSDHDQLNNIISKIEGGNIRIKISPDMYDILLGSVKMNNIFGALLFELNTDSMPLFQQIVKRILDFFISLVSIIILIPFYFVMAILVKLSSEGSILFLQERIGLNGIPFKIIKFRTMFVNSESTGPQLSSDNDPRITGLGKIMRKFRLDEFPQFVNVLKGDMSLVGPRPERQFYIDQIVKLEPQFSQLTKVKPGVTSWGQVKFGYAENVEQMIQRMKFDLLYIKNRTLTLDFKIMMHTIVIILKAKGK